MDDSQSQIRNPKYQMGQLENNRTPLVRFDISDFGFEIGYRPFSKFSAFALNNVWIQLVMVSP